MDQYFYTLDYQLGQVSEWRAEMWDRYQNAEFGSEARIWYYKCWQDLDSLQAGLPRLIEVVGDGR